MAREKLYKKCPRCGEKTFAQAQVCDNCKLIFSRLEFASNKEAKRQIKAGNRHAVIKTRTFPKDLNRWKLFGICAVGGLVGAHNIYIGRYIKGFFALFGILILAGLILAVPSETLANMFTRWLFVPYGIITYLWFYDLFMIGINKYKVPIAIEMPGRDFKNEQK